MRSTTQPLRAPARKRRKKKVEGRGRGRPLTLGTLYLLGSNYNPKKVGQHSFHTVKCIHVHMYGSEIFDGMRSHPISLDIVRVCKNMDESKGQANYKQDESDIQ